MKFLGDRHGDMFAFFAILMIFLMLPLSSLAVDIVRGMYVRGHLHTATDAACQAAADALDAPYFVQSGVKQIKPALARSQASRVFTASLVDADRVGFTPSLSVSVIGPLRVRCTSSANVSRLLPGTPVMNVLVETVSEMRVTTY
ncbi:MAG: hypothetical protein HOC56_08890 [Anaerolineae bacterium]|jgi:hypothetical protein|nr:hypothetical protein [Anaerolineae bacterium]MBT4458374.1 hypothetical protein [Anaerolineae bacterium]MBT6322588.1 hypothetical protein [Anaerolineae bacterium]MBT7017660.1 hypothetical protein [Anaerolineae bacterium]